MSSLYQTDLAVIGGGASGMAAAISAARALPDGYKITILERGPRVGKKILSTGNGRCNLTNHTATADRYHCVEPTTDGGFPMRYSSDYTLAFFQLLGLYCRQEEDGRYYPCSGQASSVLDALRYGLEEARVSTLCDCAPRSIQTDAHGFRLSCGESTVRCRAVILAAGGKAAPASGSDGSGYPLAQTLGHRLTPLYPALAPVRTDPTLTRPMKGMRSTGAVTLLADGKPLRTEIGEIQFADGALSGVCVFQLSRYAGEFASRHTVGGAPCREACLSLDLIPEYDASQLLSLLRGLTASHPTLLIEQFLSGLLNKRVGQALLKSLAFAPLSAPCGELSERQLRQIASRVKDWRFPITGLSPWNQAQVTAGGLSLKEFYPDTLESRITPGFYAAGEILDIDGDCGGFNLQWAWSSGILAGQSAARHLLHKRGNKPC